jgi:putative membrane protein
MHRDIVAWTLVFHLIGMVFWLGTLLAVTHILAIHTETPSPEARSALGRLEMKLLKGLARPGAGLMLLTGIIMVGQNPHYLREHWLQAKLLLVAVLIVLDLRVYFRSKAFLAGRIELQRRECMALHGAISLVFFGILILVLLKPFGMKVRETYVAGALRVPPASEFVIPSGHGLGVRPLTRK